MDRIALATQRGGILRIETNLVTITKGDEYPPESQRRLAPRLQG